jgi:hypothetical protein
MLRSGGSDTHTQPAIKVRRSDDHGRTASARLLRPHGVMEGGRSRPRRGSARVHGWVRLDVSEMSQ